MTSSNAPVLGRRRASTRAAGSLTLAMGVKPQMMAAIAGIDIALLDLKGKLLGQPVFRLLGGGRSTVPAYASGGYYGPEGESAIGALVEEMNGYVELGYTTVKMKVGGLSIEDDVRRVRTVRKCIGPNVSVLLDANQAYDVASAIAAARAFEPYVIGWFEEPVHWYDSVFGLGKVSRAINIPTASGESEVHRWACRDLYRTRGHSHHAIRLHPRRRSQRVAQARVLCCGRTPWSWPRT